MLQSTTQDHTAECVEIKIINSSWQLFLERKYSITPKHRSHIIYEILYRKDKRKQYKTETENQLQKQPFAKNTQQKWTNIVTATLTAAENAPEIKLKQKHHVSKKINELSKLQNMSNCNEIYQKTKMKEKTFVQKQQINHKNTAILSIQKKQIKQKSK